MTTGGSRKSDGICAMSKSGLLCSAAMVALCCGAAGGARAADPASVLGQLASDLSWTSAGTG